MILLQVYKPHLTPPPVSAGVTKFLCATPALPHSQANCLGEDGEVAGERDHDVAVVRRDHVLERRDGARDRGLGDDREDAEHGKAAVVDLSEAPARLLLGGVGLEEVEGVVEVEMSSGRLPLMGG